MSLWESRAAWDPRTTWNPRATLPPFLCRTAQGRCAPLPALEKGAQKF